MRSCGRGRHRTREYLRNVSDLDETAYKLWVADNPGKFALMPIWVCMATSDHPDHVTVVETYRGRAKVIGEMIEAALK